MNKLLSIFVFVFALWSCTNSASTGTKTIWQIGQDNRNASEFALAPAAYADFLKHDFGWEDRFYLVGKSKPETDWPYILPGPDDAWGGTGGTSGIRTHVLNVLFALNETDASKYQLKVHFLDVSNISGSVIKISVNGKSWTQQARGWRKAVMSPPLFPFGRRPKGKRGGHTRSPFNPGLRPNARWGHSQYIIHQYIAP